MVGGHEHAILTIEFGGWGYPPIPSPEIPELRRSATAGEVCCTVTKFNKQQNYSSNKLKSVRDRIPK